MGTRRVFRGISFVTDWHIHLLSVVEVRRWDPPCAYRVTVLRQTFLRQSARMLDNARRVFQ
jgi:hypothetical protein